MGRCVGSGWVGREVQVCVWVCTHVGVGGGLDVLELYGDTVMSVYLCPRLHT